MVRLAADSAYAAPVALRRYTRICVGATFCLIFVGGLVTSTGSALAVPDWPLAFGRLIPQLQGGVRFEYGHRVAAGLVALMTLGLALWCARSEPRRAVRRMAYAAVAMVLFQAVLGGVTVLLELPLVIAVAHAATAQAFFCLMVAIAVVMNLPLTNERAPAYARPVPASLPPQAVVVTVAIYLQILVGAVMRHLGAGLAIPDFPLAYGRLVPPLDSGFVAINFAHRVGALSVTILIIWTALRVLRDASGMPRLRRLALGWLVLLGLQLTFGALTVWSRRAVLPTTAHVAIGAAVLAVSLALTLQIYAFASQAAGEPAKVRRSPVLPLRPGAKV